MIENMKKSLITIATILLATGWLNCVLAQDFNNGKINFIFKPENNWTQMVIWLENEKGEYVETAFISNFIGRRGGGNRTSDTDIDSQIGNRLSALPVWGHKRNVIDTTYGIENYYPPDVTQAAYPDDMDAVSAATPDQTIQTKNWQLVNLSQGSYTCWIEVNRSYDVNPYHQYSYYRGQPSLIWKTTIDVTNATDSNKVLDYFGYGAPDGSNGEINPPDSTITTAEDLLQDLGGYKFKVVYTPEDTDVASHLFADKSFVLQQNYPNPFNSVTEIKYSLPESNRVNLTVYTMTGQKVATLVDAQRAAGNQVAIWDGRNATGQEIANGIYLYKIRIGKYTETKAMVFLK